MDKPDTDRTIWRPPVRGFPFPRPVLLITENPTKALEGTLVEIVRPFHTTDLHDAYENVIISTDGMSDGSYRELVDWINVHVAPRIRPGRTPVWL